jgi:hypothetical protein
VYLHPTATVNCAPVPFRHPGESAEYREFIMVHELLHGLGMVPTCAPHWTNDNHVSETQDVMTGGTIGNNQQLDVGRDDYFRAHIPGCVDLANSTYMAAPPPGAPGNAAATAGDHAAAVSFSAASGTVTSYVVTSSPGGVTATGTSSPITVPGLANGVTYTFTVAAFNGTEPGAASAPSNAIVPNTPPGPPTGVTAFAGDGTATVFFSPPASAGDSAIESYTVAASPGGKTVVGTHSPITVTGLVDGTEYTFTVRATNALATGPPSAPSNAVVPGKPERVHLEPPLPSPRPDVPDVVIPPGGPRRPPPLH